MLIVFLWASLWFPFRMHFTLVLWASSSPLGEESRHASRSRTPRNLEEKAAHDIGSSSPGSVIPLESPRLSVEMVFPASERCGCLANGIAHAPGCLMKGRCYSCSCLCWGCFSCVTAGPLENRMMRSYREGGESLSLPETQVDREPKHNREPPAGGEGLLGRVASACDCGCNTAGNLLSVGHRTNIRELRTDPIILKA